MADEIERKFLLRNDHWRALVATSCKIEQTYLALTGPMSVRVRIVDERAAKLTLKTARAGSRRQEYEYSIPLNDAVAMMSHSTHSAIKKTRYRLPAGQGLEWEIDVFTGDNDGLVVAEIELSTENQQFERPSWLGKEVTDDRRYYNASLATRPYRDWSDGT